MVLTRSRAAEVFDETRASAWKDQENASRASWGQLTTREQEILLTLESGASVGEIATRLRVSVGTVKTHLLHIYAKLAVHNRVQAVVLARRLREEAKNHAIA